MFNLFTLKLNLLEYEVQFAVNAKIYHQEYLFAFDLRIMYYKSSLSQMFF